MEEADEDVSLLGLAVMIMKLRAKGASNDRITRIRTFYRSHLGVEIDDDDLDDPELLARLHPEEGRREMRRLLEEISDDEFYNLFRMNRPIFHRLCGWLAANTTAAASRSQTIEQKVMVFLWIMAYDEPQRNAAYRFQISQSSVSRIMQELLKPMEDLHRVFVQLPDPTYQSLYVELNPKYSQFNGAIGAIDGTHIRAHVPRHLQKRWWSRKSSISQNVFVAVTFDGLFSYVMPGAEGSFNDASIAAQAFTRGFEIPDNRFYLADAGFGKKKGIIMPFSGLTYHLPAWEQEGRRPATSKELYNYRHSQLRTIVEQTFGMCKRKWKIIRNSAPEYSLEDQISIVFAATGLFNFIQLGGRTPQEAWRDDIAALDVADLYALKFAAERCNEVVPRYSSAVMREILRKCIWQQYRMYIRATRGVWLEDEDEEVDEQESD